MSDLVFEIELLLGEFIFKLCNLAVSESIIDGDRYLSGDLGQKLQILRCEGVFVQPHQAEQAKDAIAPDQWEHAHGFNTLFGSDPVFKTRFLQFADIPNPWLSGSKDLAGQRAVERAGHILTNQSLTEGEIQRVRLKVFFFRVGQDEGNTVQTHHVPNTGRDGLQNIA